MIDVTAIRERFLDLSAHLDERGKRIFAATEARTAGYGGIAAVSRARYPKRIVVSDREMNDLNITRNSFYVEWNYTIHPTQTNPPPGEAS